MLRFAPIVIITLLLGTGAAIADTYEQMVLADNPLDYWRLNETSVGDLTANEVAGRLPGTAGTLGGGVSAGESSAGPGMGSSVGLDGEIGSRVQVWNGTSGPDFSSLTTQFSVEAWIKGDWTNGFATNTSSAYETIVSQWNTLSPGSSTWNIGTFTMYTTAHRKFDDAGNPVEPDNISARIALLVDGSFLSAPSGPQFMTSDVWYHVVATYDGTKTNSEGNPISESRIYINGVSGALVTNVFGMGDTTAIDQAVSGGNWGPLQIGSDRGGTGVGPYPFHGMIDEVAVYSYSLSADQILEHYEAGVAVPLPPAVLAGLGLLGAMGVGRRVRRRKASAD